MRGLRAVSGAALLLLLAAGGPAGCSPVPGPVPTPRTATFNSPPTPIAPHSPSPSATTSRRSPSPSQRSARRPGQTAAPRTVLENAYPWHTDIVSTTFWVGEIFDPNAPDGSQVISTYDSRWMQDYGGCDGVVRHGTCSTERRTASNDWFPTAMTPKENPFYLDLPFDDVNDSVGFRTRSSVVPWAHDERYAAVVHDPAVSLMKNRWVELERKGRTCYGQIEDAGPGQYHDATYVFGSTDARPANRRYGGAGLDVSPALNGCLAFTELDGDTDRLSWRFIERTDVPNGPWTRVVTTTGVR